MTNKILIDLLWEDVHDEILDYFNEQKIKLINSQKRNKELKRQIIKLKKEIDFEKEVSRLNNLSLKEFIKELNKSKDKK